MVRALNSFWPLLLWRDFCQLRCILQTFSWHVQARMCWTLYILQWGTYVSYCDRLLTAGLTMMQHVALCVYTDMCAHKIERTSLHLCVYITFVCVCVCVSTWGSRLLGFHMHPHTCELCIFILCLSGHLCVLVCVTSRALYRTDSWHW